MNAIVVTLQTHYDAGDWVIPAVGLQKEASTMGAFSPERFGERLRVLRGTRTLEEISQISAVPPHTIARIGRGAIDKPSFRDVIQLGKAYGLRPDEMAALADIYVSDESETDTIDRDAADMIRRVRNCYWDAGTEDKRILTDLLSAVVDVFRRRQARLPEVISAPATPVPHRSNGID